MAGDLGSEGLEILILLLCLIGEEIKTGHLSSFITELLPPGDLGSASGSVIVNPLYQPKTSGRRPTARLPRTETLPPPL